MEEMRRKPKNIKNGATSMQFLERQSATIGSEVLQCYQELL